MVSVLIVDDDERLCHAIADGLVKADYDTREANSGKELLDLLREAPSDIVITDLYMPDFDGFEVIMHLRREIPSVHIIAMSGADHSKADYLKVAAQFGAAYTVKKPYRFKELLELVAACVTIKPN
jgi:DNA-binding response OmpR family regulator